ncbi:MAG: hypothetical protein ACRD19_07380 [Terriglobia bacterium]
MRQHHQSKLDEERKRPDPDGGLIRYWEKEIANWTRQIEQIDRKLQK